jgi:hypothetical protein
MEEMPSYRRPPASQGRRYKKGGRSWSQGRISEMDGYDAQEQAAHDWKIPSKD